MTIHSFQSALIGNEWHQDVSISVNDDGIISEISCGSLSSEPLKLVALPGMVNVHSHAFQRAFAGLSEYRTATHDSFWTWRKLMYQFVNRLDPDEVYVIARQLYLEMLMAGYTWVGEFHYLHNRPGGDLYSNLSEMSEAIRRAASDSGIGLCHLPVLYQRGGFDGRSLAAGQDRFALTNEQFVDLVSGLHSNWTDQTDLNLGIALHSLRAVSAESGNEVIAALRNSLGSIPVHIHVAEQTAEVNGCLEHHNQRSVEYLFNNFQVDQHWCLIHATHLDDQELNSIAQSGAVAGLCPTTEANLGDGFFRASEFFQQGGIFAIGSDSHCSVDLRDELRLLEYGQRLQQRRRAVLGTEHHSVGRHLYGAAARGGAQAIGVNAGEIQVGNRADFTLVDPEQPAIAGVTGDRLMDRLIFTNVGNPIAGVVVGGRAILTNSDQFREQLVDSFREFRELQNRL